MFLISIGFIIPVHIFFPLQKKKPVAVLLRKITETDCRGRMCGARLAGNRNSNWASKFLARALSCNYTLTCLTISQSLFLIHKPPRGTL